MMTERSEFGFYRPGGVFFAGELVGACMADFGIPRMAQANKNII